MVRDALSDHHLIQLKVVTGTLNAQKYQDEILESGVRSPLDSVDGQNMVITPPDLNPIELYRTPVSVLKPGTSRIKTIVNFARLYCMSGTGCHVLNACTQ